MAAAGRRWDFPFFASASSWLRMLFLGSELPVVANEDGDDRPAVRLELEGLLGDAGIVAVERDGDVVVPSPVGHGEGGADRYPGCACPEKGSQSPVDIL